VSVDELLRMVNIALGNVRGPSACSDNNGDRGITVDEILSAVNNALNDAGSNRVSVFN